MTATTKQREKTQTKVNSRRLLYTCNTLLVVLIVFAAGVIVNLLGDRYNWRYDTTKHKLYSLSEQTVQTLGALDQKREPLEIIAFYQEGSNNERMMRDLLTEYKERSKGLNFKFIDPFKHPAETKRYQIQQEGTILLVMGEEERKVFPRDIFSFSYYGPSQFYGEQAVTRAITKLLSEGEKSLYFLQGHGEGSISNEFYHLTSYLRAEGYQVNDLNLSKTGAIPADCDLLISAGPKQDFLDQERDLLISYAQEGGRMILLLDYSPPRNRIPNIMKLLADWGLGVEDSMVVELERRSLFDISTVIPDYAGHEITRELQSKETNLLFPANRALIQTQDYTGDTKSEIILRSSANSWAERNPQGEVEQNQGETAGPIPLAIAAQRKLTGSPVETSETANANAKAEETTEGSGATGESVGADEESIESRLLLLGNSIFIENSYVQQAGNLNFFYNAVQWLLGEEDKITILPKQTQLTQATVPAGEGIMIRWFSMAVLPLVILCLGGVVWIRRRRR